PLIRKLWQGDVAHDGDHWQFPTATACPKPVQDDVPMWVAARSPTTFDYAVEQDCNVMCWPLTMPMSEAEACRDRLAAARAKCDRPWTGQFAMMRHTSVYETDDDRQASLDALRGVLAMFGNLMMQTGDVVNGFPEKVPLDQLEGNVRVDPDMLEQNLMMGDPATVIAKLRAYEALGVDSFIYYASMGLDPERQKRSLQLFIDHVMPEFAQ
ncbi:MAG: LLM class flavin-dependent oxidoreductase, partial [Paracoccaceae bacterium]